MSIKTILLILFCISCQISFGQTILWSGSLDATQSAQKLTIRSTSFAEAQEGQILRMHFTDAKYEASLRLTDGKGNAIPSYETDPICGSAGIYNYTLETTLLSVVKKSGVCIQCTGYVLTQVTLEDCKTNSNGLKAYIPVTNDWIFNESSPTVDVRIINSTSNAQTSKVKLSLTTDLGKSYLSKEKAFTIAANQSIIVSIPFTANPGFYTAALTLNGTKIYPARAKNNGKTSSSFVIGVRPESIVSKDDAQNDFNSFWSKTKEELGTIAPNFTLQEIKAQSSSNRKVYLLEYQSLKDKGDSAAIVRGYYAEPTGIGKYPCIIHYQGYDEINATDEVPSLNGEDNPDYAELILCTRGQLLNNRTPYVNHYGEWFVYGLESKENYYYRGAYMDALRAIDFVANREHVDENNIFAEGYSQGGALSYAVAALSDIQLCAIAPANPFMGDFTDYFQFSDIWVYNMAQEAQTALGITSAQMYQTLSYFDTKNLSSRINCPVLESIGLQDKVCPPHTNMAPYNNLPAHVEKSILYNPLLEHLTPYTWKDSYLKFFSQHMRETTYNIDVTDAQWSTVCLPLEAPVPIGLEAYIVEGANTSTGVLQLNEVQKIQPNTPYLIHGQAGTYTFSGTPYHSNTMPTLTAGCMTGTYEASQISNLNAYVLQDQEGEVGFYRIKAGDSKEIPAYKAYILLDMTAKNSFLRLNAENAIEEVPLDTTPNTAVSLQGYQIPTSQRNILIIDSQRRKTIVVE